MNWILALTWLAFAGVTIRAQTPPGSREPSGPGRGGVTNQLPRGKAAYLALQFGNSGGVAKWWAAPMEQMVASAERGDADAQIALAHQLVAQPEGAKHLTEAGRWIRAAADQGHAQGLYLMGWLALNDWPVGGGPIVANYEEAREWLEKAVAAGSTQAAFSLGDLYWYGKLDRNYATAEKLFLQAAGNGHLEAMRRLVALYGSDHPNADGSTWVERPEESQRWQREVDQREEEERRRAASLAGGDGSPSPQPRRQASREPAPSAGDQTERLLAQALAAASNDQEAEMILKVRARNRLLRGGSTNGPAVVGEPVPSRPASASLELARRFELGEGVPRDLIRALSLYGQIPRYPVNDAAQSAAAAVVRLLASPELDVRAGTGPLPPLPNSPQLVASPAARLQLANLLWNGSVIVTPDPSNAVAWYLRAAQAGSPEAMRRLSQFWAEGVNGEPDAAEAEKWLRRAERAEQTATPGSAK